MTTQDIATEVWGQVSDPAGVRWPITELYKYIYEGELAIVRRHPEAQYGTSVTASTVVLLSTVGGIPTVSDYWQAALAHYVSARVLGEDSEDSHNLTLSETHFKHFKEAMNIGDEVSEVKAQ